MLDLNHVSMTFNPGTVNEKKALTDINLHMESGEFATIVGSNGAGKSTLFNAIAGSFIPDTGSILLDGVDMTFQPDFRRSKAIGRLFQDPLKGTAPNMTIEENLALAYLRASTHTSPFSRITKADRELFTDRLVQLGLGLENRMKQPVGLLSGGQRQALTLLMATLVTPKLLLLDEHTAALDPATADKVLELTKKIVAENHITCLMITHNMHAALELGNRTLMMDSGHIVLDISGEERASIICAFGLASAAPRSPYRHLELCGIASGKKSTGDCTKSGNAQSAQYAHNAACQQNAAHAGQNAFLEIHIQ